MDASPVGPRLALETPGPRPHEHLAAQSFELGSPTPARFELPAFKFEDAGFKRVTRETLEAGGPLLPAKLRDAADYLASGMIAPPTPASDRAAAYLADVKARLTAEGLPTSAPHAKIGILRDAYKGELTGHGAPIARALAGPHALAQGADVRFDARDEAPHSRSFELRTPWLDASSHPENDTIDSLAKKAVRAIAGDILNTANRVMAALDVLPPAVDGRTRFLLNLSSGYSIARSVANMTNTIADARVDAGSTLGRDLAARAGSSRDWGDDDVASALRDAIKRELQEQEATLLKPLREHLTHAVATLRASGGLLFVSAGNDNRIAKDLSDAKLQNVVPGMIVVGSADVTDPHDPKSLQMAGSSSGGLGYTTFTTVGVDLPIGENGTLESGTSFAVSIGVSIAALMTEANPKLTPNDIENILKDPRVAHDLPETERDGAGVVDPVAAVRLARDWPA
jgi:hypothetical protein